MRTGPSTATLAYRPLGSSAHADQRERLHGRVNIAQADMHAHFSGRRLQEPSRSCRIFCFSSNAWNSSHIFSRVICRIDADQGAGAIHVNVGREPEIEQALVVEHGQMMHDRIDRRPFFGQAPLQLLSGYSPSPNR